MGKYEIGKTFRTNFDSWKVLDREGSYLLLENGNGRIWCTANINRIVGSNDETCDPSYFAEDATSRFYDKQCMTEFFEAERQKIRQRAVNELEKQAAEKARMQALDAWSRNIAEAKARRDQLVSDFRKACNGSEFDDLDKKKLATVASEINLIDQYLKYIRG